MAKTQQERMKLALEKRGWIEDVHHRTTRYIAMKPTELTKFYRAVSVAGGESSVLEVPFDVDFHGHRRYFLGTAGSLRYASNGRVSSATPQPRRKTKFLSEVL